jgi:hypothetical protein
MRLMMLLLLSLLLFFVMVVVLGGFDAVSFVLIVIPVAVIAFALVHILAEP